jgi:hypothetical protein
MTATSATVRDAEAQAYLDGVAAELGDLPDEERADLLDELAAHLDELVAEGDVPLAARLGEPAGYAAELRASAGLPSARPAGGPGVASRATDAMAWLRTQRRRPSVVVSEEFVRSLRPAWWVLRAWVLLALLTWFAQPHWWRSLVVVPDVGPDVLSVLLLAVAVVGSVQVGRRGRSRSVAGTLLVAALNLVAAVGVWPVLLTMNEAVQTGAYNDYGPSAQYVTRAPTEGVYANGSQLWNVYAYDAQGRMLHDVRLYDQDGAPVSLGLAPDATRRPVVDQQGRLVQNAYPYRYLEPDGTVADIDAGPTIDAPPLVGVVTPSASTAPTPTATASPGPGGRS